MLPRSRHNRIRDEPFVFIVAFSRRGQGWVAALPFATVRFQMILPARDEVDS